MFDGLISGRVCGQPAQRTGQSGKTFVIAKLRVPVAYSIKKKRDKVQGDDDQKQQQPNPGRWGRAQQQTKMDPFSDDGLGDL